MLVSALIVSFILGIVVTLLVQYVFISRRLLGQPTLEVVNRPQTEKFKLPKVIVKSLGLRSKITKSGKDGKKSGRGSKKKQPAPAQETDSKSTEQGTKVTEEKGSEDKRGTLSSEEEQILVLNLLFHFLFAELKDTPRVRQWATRKMNTEFEEMLSTGTGKFLSGIQIRDFNFGSTFPVVKVFSLDDVKIEDDLIETLDVGLDIDYDGGFQLAVDVDIVLQTWAYLSIKVTKLCGKARLQLTRIPFTHWSFSFYEEPKMEFEVDSRFNGRPIPQISSLIVNQIKRTIRKKHILPNYKMRFKPVFVRTQDTPVAPSISCRGAGLSRGQLLVNVVGCTRLTDLAADSRLYCTLSVDKEDMEEVWRQSWVTIDVEVRIPQNSLLGLTLKEQVSGQKTEKHRLIVDHVVAESPADLAEIRKDDIIELISGTKVMSLKHATKLMKNSGDRYTIQLKREQKNMSQEELLHYREKANDTQNPIKSSDLRVEEMEEFVHISVEEDLKSLKQVSQTAYVGSQAPKKLSDSPLAKRGMSLISAGKKKLLGGKDGRELVVEPDPSHVRRRSNPSETEIKAVTETNAARVTMKDHSQSAKSSPQKQVRDMKRQRAHSDTSLNKVMDGDSSSLSGEVDTGSSDSQEERRLGQVSTREVPFSRTPEWNEVFGFDCNEDDQYLNVCVWCKMAQTDRNRKQIATKGEDSKLQVADMLERYYVTKKIGYASLPLSDVTAGCILNLQGDCTYTVYLQPPEELIIASHSKLPYSTHPGYNPSIAVGDITLSFTHVPFRKVDPLERKKIVHDILYPSTDVFLQSEETFEEQEEGQHKFVPMHFQSGTRCDFCGKKIWLKEAMYCDICKMVCHKKCVEKCQGQTFCTVKGVKMKSNPEEPWVPPLRTSSSAGDQEKEESSRSSIFRKLRTKEQASLPLNIPAKQGGSDISPSASPVRSPLRGGSPMTMNGPNMSSSLSNTSIEKFEEDEQKSRLPGYSLDDQVVIEAKEKGRELYAHLSLSERKQTLDDKLSALKEAIDKESEHKCELVKLLSALKEAIDKESEHKCELMKLVSEISDVTRKKLLTQQMDKCEEKLESLMMMMVHYCAGLQHCLDTEEAQRRLQVAGMGAVGGDVRGGEGEGVVERDGPLQASGDSDNLDWYEDAGIQFIVTEDHY